MCYDMYMIGNATNLVEMTVFVFQNATYVFEQLFAIIRGKRKCSVLIAEDNLIKDLCVCAHHDVFYSTLFGVGVVLGIVNPRIASGVIDVEVLRTQDHFGFMNMDQDIESHNYQIYS